MIDEITVGRAASMASHCASESGANPTASRVFRAGPGSRAPARSCADAAGGPDSIVSGDDVDAPIAGAHHADLRALQQARAHRQHLRAKLDRAEQAAAPAFAEAETRSADHVIAPS